MCICNMTWTCFNISFHISYNIAVAHSTMLRLLLLEQQKVLVPQLCRQKRFDSKWQKCIYVHIYIYMCVFINTYIYICIYIHIYAHVYLQHTHKHILDSTASDGGVCKYMYIYIYMYVYTYIYICIYIHISAHVYLRHTHKRILDSTASDGGAIHTFVIAI